MKITNHMLSDSKVDTSIKSPNQNGTIKPTLIVLHYTASGGEDGEGDASYLSRASARASAHVVIGRNGSIHQIIPFNKRAWHAGVSEYKGTKDVNDFSIGIEIDNWGWLKNGKSHLGEKVTNVFKGTRSGHSEWEAYPQVQLDAVEEVIKALTEAYPITRIVGHEDIAPGRKQDPGPALDEFKEHVQKYVKTKAPTSTSKKTKAAPKEGTKEVTGAGLRLRVRPNRTATILTHLPKGAKVKELKRDVYPGWSQIQYGSRTGYVANQYLA